MFKQFVDEAMVEFGVSAMHVTLEKWETGEDGVPVLISVEFDFSNEAPPAPEPEEPPVEEPEEPDAPPVYVYTVTDDKSVAFKIVDYNSAGYPVMGKVDPVVRFDRGAEVPVWAGAKRADGGSLWFEMYDHTGYYLSADKGTVT